RGRPAPLIAELEPGRERRLDLALRPELLDRDVLRRVHLGPGDDPAGPVLVPDPDVLHGQVHEWIGGRVRRLHVQPVAQIRGLGRQHAVAEEAEHRRVLALEPQLELGVELLQVFDVGHAGSLVPPRWAGQRTPGMSRLVRAAYSSYCGNSARMLRSS